MQCACLSQPYTSTSHADLLLDADKLYALSSCVHLEELCPADLLLNTDMRLDSLCYLAPATALTCCSLYLLLHVDMHSAGDV